MAEVKLKFIVIGKEGLGKSKTRNAILNTTVCNTPASSGPSNRDVDFSVCKFGQYSLQIVDSPSCIDYGMDRGELDSVFFKNMEKSLSICFGGVDAFLVVLQYRDQLTKEEILTLMTLKKKFGGVFLNHVIIVVTCGNQSQDEMKEAGRDIIIEKWCEKQVVEFREMFDYCEGRIAFFNNSEINENKKLEQTRKLVEFAHGIQINYGRYTMDDFKHAQRKCKTLTIQNSMCDLVKQTSGDMSLEVRGSKSLLNKLYDSEKPKIQVTTDNQLQRLQSSGEDSVLKTVTPSTSQSTGSKSKFLHQSANLTEPELTAEIFDKMRLLVEFNESLSKRPSDGDIEIVQSIVWELKRAIQEQGTSSELMKDLLAEVKIIEDQHAVVLDKTSTVMHRSNIESSQMHIDDEEVRLNVLLIGKTGHGKSATGNMILNRRVFKTSTNTMSQTKKVKSSFAQLGRYILLVVDGPGLEDTDMTKVQNTEAARKNMDIALSMCYGGVDAFLFVFKFGAKFTNEERSVLKDLKRIFGDTFMNHVIIVVTAGDLFTTAMREDGRSISFKEWCMEQEGEFYQLCADCQDRVVLCDNRMSDKNNMETRQAQREQIVKLVLDLQTRNGHYTSESFKKADIERKKLEKDVPQLTREIQEKIYLLGADIDALPGKPSEAVKKKIIERIQNLKKEIELQDGGSGVLKDSMEIVKSMEINLDDVVKIRELARVLDGTRTLKEIWNRVGNVLTIAGCILTVIFPPVGIGMVVGSRIGAVAENGTHTLLEKDLQIKIQDKRLNLKK